MTPGAELTTFRRLEELEEGRPVRVDGRQLVGVLCVLCDSWDCERANHLPTKRAVYIRAPGGRLELETHRPNPHHEGTARYHLTAKGAAEVTKYRLTQGQE